MAGGFAIHANGPIAHNQAEQALSIQIDLEYFKVKLREQGLNQLTIVWYANEWHQEVVQAELSAASLERYFTLRRKVPHHTALAEVAK